MNSFFLQWDSILVRLFLLPRTTYSPNPVHSNAQGLNPQSATVLFTPLQEYKLRGSFATPIPDLTVYTDLAMTHDTILLRGEITPSPSDPAKFLFSQLDAQALTLAIQKFYLWDDHAGSGELPEGQRLLRAFHETPEDFKWEDLLEFSKLTI